MLNSRRVSKCLTPIVAFSLPEILLVIAIIGFFAMLIITPFIGYADQRENVIRLKRAYGDFSTVLIKLSADYGCPNNLKCTGLFAASSSDKTIGDAIAKYFRVLKNCETVPNLGCMSKNVSSRYDGTSIRENFDNSNYRFIAIDGTSFSILNYKNDCAEPVATAPASKSNAGCSNDTNGDANGNGGQTNNGTDQNGSGNGNKGNNPTDKCEAQNESQNNMAQVCGALYIDVNTEMKGPNNFGRDIFAFWITNGSGPKIYPVGGAQDVIMGWWKNPNSLAPKYCYPGQSYGLWCTGRIIEEGWEMNY